MPVNITQWAAGGLSAIQVGARGPNGYFTGFANLTTADEGETSGMHRIRGSVSAASPTSGINRIRNRGENGWVATRLFQSEPPDFTLGFEAQDLDAEVALSGGQLYTLGELTMILRGQSLPDLQDTVTLLTREATSLEAAATGEGYANLLILSSKYRGVPGNSEWQAVNAFELQGTADPVLLSPWGAALEAAFGKSDGTTIEFFSTYPVTLDCFIGDNTIDDIPLTYTPISTAKTHAFRQDTGAALTVSAVNTPADTVTVSAAPSAGLPVLILYQTEEL
jgi:hypothetical protein